MYQAKPARLIRLVLPVGEAGCRGRHRGEHAERQGGIRPSLLTNEIEHHAGAPRSDRYVAQRGVERVAKPGAVQGILNPLHRRPAPGERRAKALLELFRQRVEPVLPAVDTSPDSATKPAPGHFGWHDTPPHCWFYVD
jgi:hypothetical protein